jgi:glycosyltransferase involved in cell wall biosynthesis
MITIVTPTYNRKVLVQRTIASVLNQTYTDWQLIIVDDGSTDGTEAALYTFLKDSRIEYIKKENSGQADSLNTGAANAKGEFLVFLDSDDEAYPNWLERINLELQSNTGIVCAGAIRQFADGTRIEEGMNEFYLFGQHYKLKFTCGSLFIRTAIFSAIKGYDITLRSNIQTDLGYRLLDYLRKTDLRIVVVNEYLVQINIHDGERIRTNWQMRREGGIQFINKHYNFICDNDRKEAANIFASIAFASYKLNMRSESVSYVFKSIRHNPFRVLNYFRFFKYAFL